jgi:hypothetical protein
MRVYIIGNDEIILCREPPVAANEGEIVVASNEELHAAQLSGKRLLAQWDALPGVEKRRKVGDLEALIDQLWSAIEALPDSQPDAEGPSQDAVIAILQRPGGATVDEVASASTKTATRRKGRQAPQSAVENRPAAPAAAAEIGDPAKDNASAGEALPIIGRAVCEDGGAPEKPDDAVEITEQTVGLSEGDPAPSQTPPEIEVQASRPNTKRAQLIGLLERPEGASVGEIGERLGWLPHTVRAALTGLRHAGREVSRDKNAEGRSIYRLAPVATSTR